MGSRMTRWGYGLQKEFSPHLTTNLNIIQNHASWDSDIVDNWNDQNIFIVGMTVAF